MTCATPSARALKRSLGLRGKHGGCRVVALGAAQLRFGERDVCLADRVALGGVERARLCEKAVRLFRVSQKQTRAPGLRQCARLLGSHLKLDERRADALVCARGLGRKVEFEVRICKFHLGDGRLVRHP